MRSTCSRCPTEATLSTVAIMCRREAGGLRRRLKAAASYARQLLRPKAVEGSIQLDPNTGLPAGISGKITLGEPESGQGHAAKSADSLLMLADEAFGTLDLTAWVLLDRLDVAFAETAGLEENALRADLARAKTGIDQVRVVHRPRLLSDNGPCYVSGELADYLETHKIAHTRGAPYHPMTQGKIERYHRSMKNVVKLEKYHSPWELERAIARFVDDYNHRRLHEALDNVTPADAYEGRRPAILARRAQIKRRTLAQRKRENLHNPHGAVNRPRVSLVKQAHWSPLV